MIRAIKHVTKRVDELERQIGLNLMHLRHLLKMSQATLAAHLNLTSAQVSTIEAGRIALKMQTGWEACRLFNIHPNVLLQGFYVKEVLPFPPSNHPMMPRIEQLIAANKNTLFSEGWANMKWVLDEKPNAPPIPSPTGLHGRVLVRTAIDRELVQNRGLTIAPASENMPSMKRELEAVLDKARELTKGRGEKSKLAKYLGVSTSRISEWLAGKCEPGGQATLALLRWVEEKQGHK